MQLPRRLIDYVLMHELRVLAVVVFEGLVEVPRYTDVVDDVAAFF